jgi:FkbM family methyltransferase
MDNDSGGQMPLIKRFCFKARRELEYVWTDRYIVRAFREQIMASIRGFLKPCYLFSPSTAFRRVFMELFPPKAGVATVSLPWKVSLEVDLSDAIGKEIFKQRSFDIALSEVAWRLLQPGAKALDVGANIGYLTSLFAVRAGPSGAVHAFEPHPKVQQALTRNIARIGAHPKSAPISMHVCALGDVSGQAQLIETDYFQINRGTARIAEAKNEEGIRSHPVSMETLDNLFPNDCFELAKIDVEGFELRVLQGAKRLLREKRIRHVIYEDHDIKSRRLATMLGAEGYSIFSIGYGLLGPKLCELDREIALDRSWESPSFLATIEPVAVKKIMNRRGWLVL